MIATWSAPSEGNVYGTFVKLSHNYLLKNHFSTINNQFRK